MTLTIITGPMFSGKSSYLVKKINELTLQNKKVFVINHILDKRYNDDICISTHDGLNTLNNNFIFNSSFHTFNEFLDLSKDKLNQYDYFFIDECQFFKDIDLVIDFLLSKDKHLFISFLNSDYKMEPFSVTNLLYAKADKIIHLTAKCSICSNDAPFTKRLIDSSSQILVGKNDIYVPRCRKCFF